MIQMHKYGKLFGKFTNLEDLKRSHIHFLSQCKEELTQLRDILRSLRQYTSHSTRLMDIMTIMNMSKAESSFTDMEFMMFTGCIGLEQESIPDTPYIKEHTEQFTRELIQRKKEEECSERYIREFSLRMNIISLVQSSRQNHLKLRSRIRRELKFTKQLQLRHQR